MVENKWFGKFVSERQNLITIEVFGVVETYKNIKLIEFTSESKMMTRIV
jgi:hypothetical protein